MPHSHLSARTVCAAGHWDTLDPHQVSIDVPLVDVVVNAPLQIWPATHSVCHADVLAGFHELRKHSNHERQYAGCPHQLLSLALKYPSVLQTSQMGDAIVRHMNTWHRGTPNPTNRPRPMVTIIFRRHEGVHKVSACKNDHRHDKVARSPPLSSALLRPKCDSNPLLRGENPVVTEAMWRRSEAITAAFMEGHTELLSTLLHTSTTEAIDLTDHRPRKGKASGGTSLQNNSVEAVQPNWANAIEHRVLTSRHPLATRCSDLGLGFCAVWHRRADGIYGILWPTALRNSYITKENGTAVTLSAESVFTRP